MTPANFVRIIPGAPEGTEVKNESPTGFAFFKGDYNWLVIKDRLVKGTTLIDKVNKPNTFIVTQEWKFNPNSNGGTDITRSFSDL